MSSDSNGSSNGDGTGGKGEGVRKARPLNSLGTNIPNPDRTCLGCALTVLIGVVALIVAGYLYWRFNPEFQPPTPFPPPTPRAGTVPRPNP